MRSFSSVFLRLALGLSFLSAVADRFGWWGAFGHPNVAWGSFGRFVAYTARLNWFLPQAMIPTLAVLATCVDTSSPPIGAVLVERAERHFGGLDKFDSGTRWPSFTTEGGGR
jgi:hypothetical protein